MIPANKWLERSAAAPLSHTVGLPDNKEEQ